jgi:hypothetical protein
MVDLDPERLHAAGLSPRDVTSAVAAQNLTLPSGTAKMGPSEYAVRLNSSPEALDELNDLPIKTVNGATVRLRDVAYVRDGFSPQTSIVHANGSRGALLPILKSSGASTLDIVSRVREALPGILATLPKELECTLLFDQSVFVRAAVSGVVKEAILAAGLTGLMILLFLGSWRSTLVVVTSIPLSILVSIVILAALGQTLNLMTLGGMALAVGILVDDATVEIENIHRNLHEKKPLVRAILDGARPLHHPHGAARRARRHPVDALRHRHDAQRARADGRDHEHRRRDRQQHPDGDLRERAARRGQERLRGRARGGAHAPPAGGDDGAGDDHRHVADVVRPRRGRRAERAARAGRDRRADPGDLRDPLLRPRRLQRAPAEDRAQARGGNLTCKGPSSSARP